jgi:hypothetical protein
MPCLKNKERYQPDFEAESVPQPDSVELPVLALPDVALVADGVLAGTLDAAAGVEDGVLEAVLLAAGELDVDEGEADAAPDAPVVAADGCAVDEAEPEEPVELDDDEDGDE